MFAEGIEEVEFQSKNILKVTYPPGLPNYAFQIADRILVFCPYDFTARFSLDPATSVLNCRIGHVAQIAFYYCVNGERWEELAATIPIGKLDDGDYKFRGYVIDVKSSRIPVVPRVLVTDSELERGPFDIYVSSWVHFEQSQVWFLGWAWEREVANSAIDWTLPVPAHALPFEQLHEIGELFSLPPKHGAVS